MAYEASLKAKWDTQNAFAYVEKKGREEGRQEGLQEGRQEGRREGRQEGRREGRQEGKQEGLQEGLQEGRGEEKRSIARAMKADGIPVVQISKFTGLTPEEIERL